MKVATTCAFTGHRDVGEDLDIQILEELIKTLIDGGTETFLDGMARGFDLIAAETVLKMKKEFPNIRLIACVPCRGQEKYFCEEDKKKYYSVLESCDEIKILSEKYYKGCMLTRNRFMVDNCSKVIAYERNGDGGTDYTVGYAAKKEKEIYIL